MNEVIDSRSNGGLTGIGCDRKEGRREVRAKGGGGGLEFEFKGHKTLR